MPSKSAAAPGKGSQSFPYDHLFKLLMIGDAGVGKVCSVHRCQQKRSIVATDSHNHIFCNTNYNEIYQIR
jgi:GTPase SAR1 family protein